MHFPIFIQVVDEFFVCFQAMSGTTDKALTLIYLEPWKFKYFYFSHYNLLGEMLQNCKCAMLKKILRSLVLQNSSLPRSLSKVQTTFNIPERKKPGNVQGQNFQ